MASKDGEYWRLRCLSAEATVVRLEDQLKAATARHRQAEDLELRVAQILKHNTELLHQNAQLSSQCNDRLMQLERLEARMGDLSPRRRDYFERDGQSAEVQRLLSEVNRLQNECQQVEALKNIEINNLKSKLEIEGRQKLGSLKREKHSSTEYYEVQLRKMKELLDLRLHQQEQAEHTHKLEAERLNEEIVFLNNTLTHRDMMHSIQVEELKVKLEAQIDLGKKEVSNRLEKEKNTLDKEVFRLKKELAAKGLQVQQLQGKISACEAEGGNQIKKLKIEKEKVRHEMEKSMARGVQKLERQIQQQRRAGDQEAARVAREFEVKELTLQREKKLLQKAKEQLSAECDRVRALYSGLKSSSEEELAALRSQLLEVQGQLQQQRDIHQNEVKFINAKHAELKEANLQTMGEQLKVEVQSLALQLQLKEKHIEELSARVVGQIQNRVAVRQQYENTINQLREEKTALRLQMKKTKSEMKQEQAVMRSKMEIGSMAVISESEVVKKNVFYLEQQRNKMQRIIMAKDRQIEALNAKEASVKQNFQAELERFAAKLRDKEKAMEQMESTRQKERKTDQLDKARIAALHQELQLQLEKEIDQLKSEILTVRKASQQSESRINQLQRSLEHTMRLKQSVEEELAQKNGHFQSMSVELNASAAGQQERRKLEYSKAESNLRAYYQQKVRVMERDTSDLTDRNRILQEQNLRLKGQNSGLELKLNELAGTTKVLQQLQKKVITLAVDREALTPIQNLLKNILK